MKKYIDNTKENMKKFVKDIKKYVNEEKKFLICFLGLLALSSLDVSVVFPFLLELWSKDKTYLIKYDIGMFLMLFILGIVVVGFIKLLSNYKKEVRFKNYKKMLIMFLVKILLISILSGSIVGAIFEVLWKQKILGYEISKGIVNLIMLIIMNLLFTVFINYFVYVFNSQEIDVKNNKKRLCYGFLIALAFQIILTLINFIDFKISMLNFIVKIIYTMVLLIKVVVLLAYFKNTNILN